MKKALYTLLFAAGIAFSQTPTETTTGPYVKPSASMTPAPSDLPSYFVVLGAGWNHYGTPQAMGTLSFGVGIASGIYSISSIDMTATRASMRTGIAHFLVRQDKFGLLLLGDAGIAAGGGSTTAALSGGGTMTFDISNWTRVKGTFAEVTVRVLKIGGDTVQPVFEFGFAKTF